MFKGRIWPIIAIIIGLILIFIVCRLSPSWQAARSQQATVPVDLKNVIPASWKLLPDQPQICDYDGDGEDEWLIMYRYNSTTVQPPYTQAGQTVERGPIGGVIYDAQVNYVPQDPGIQSPYRPALLIPYKLLPDFYAGKGQGYLGEGNAVLVKYTTSRDRSKCTAEEIYVLGYEDGPLPTRLSVFRWQGEDTGYAGVHFAGDAWVNTNLTPDVSQHVREVITYNRLDNHRSLLCGVQRFNRQESEPAELDFSEDPNAYTIDFCFNAPGEPEYPEGVAVALLRGYKPSSSEDMPPEIGKSYLLGGTSLPPEMGNPSANPIRILSLINQGTVAVHPSEGYLCSPQQVGTPATSIPKDTWWCGREEAEVIAEVVLPQGGGVRQALLKLISVANEQVSTDVRWRVAAVTLL